MDEKECPNQLCGVETFRDRLRQLDSLREAGLVTQEEYRIKREEILSGR